LIEIQQPTPETILNHWKMYFDGSLKLGGLMQVSSSYLQMKNNSNMFFKYSGKLQTIKQNTKHSSTDFG
jgi:hypothetical protein